MASLKEIKGRIASVASTLKITSAMKLVASAKLCKAQQAIGNMLPYEKHLHRILVDAMASVAVSDGAGDAGRVSELRPYSAAAKRGWTRPGSDTRPASPAPSETATDAMASTKIRCRCFSYGSIFPIAC